MDGVRELLAESLDSLKKKGNYRKFLNLNKNRKNFPYFTFTNSEGYHSEAVNWCSNDYLCMSLNPSAIQAANRINQESGLGSSGTRNISGTSPFHIKLENKISALHKKQGALLFGSAYLANETALSTLGKLIPNLSFFSDERNHASIVEGIVHNKNPKYIFKHNDLESLETKLKLVKYEAPKLIVFESVYSMNGSISPIKKIVDLAKKYNALTYVDEVHAVGIYGKNGAGLVEELGLENEIDIVNGTFAKAFGVLGGYLASDEVLIDSIRSFGKGFIFTTSLPPSVCGAILENLAFIGQNSSYRIEFFRNVKNLRRVFDYIGIPYLQNNSHITPVLIGDSMLCKKISQELLEIYGLYLQPINFPTVPEGEECFRVIITPRHTGEQIEYLARSLKEVFEKYKIKCQTRKIPLENSGFFTSCDNEGKVFAVTT